jgi:nitrite reductase (NO-forming)
MNTPHLVSAAVVAGLAVAAALVTTGFIQAADAAANASGSAVRPSGQTVPAAATLPGFSFVAFPSGGKKLDLARPPAGPFVAVDRASIRAFAPAMPDAPKVAGPAARAVEASQEIEANPADAPADAAARAARDEAELNALFAVAPRINSARTEAAKNAQGERGKKVYLGLCYACHQPDGRGLPGAFPMLAQSDFMAADRTRAIRIVLRGLAGPIVVNAQPINSVMPAQETVLTDQQVADVLTYVFNAWENPGGAFTADQVGSIRQEQRPD